MPTRRCLLAAAMILPGLVRAQSEPPAPVFAERGIAIRGTDVVAYFREGRVVAGLAQHAFSWQGATWRFASSANRDAFAAEPQRYAPQYGGFCAFAVSRGYSASVDPAAWKIVDGKLYLNYSRSVQRDWERDVPGNIASADTNWPAVAGRIGR